MDKRPFHLIGIGGAGMSALAQLLLEQGASVSGCDQVATEVTDRLTQLGAQLKFGHDPGHLKEETIVVYSSAIPSDDPELLAAKAQNLTVWHRSQLLAYLTQGRFGISVTGSHGKTTTSALIHYFLQEGGEDPSAIIGGKVNGLHGNARLGEGEMIVYEADESDGSFAHFSPQALVLTNLDNDHLDHYSSFDGVLKSFQTYLEKQEKLEHLFLYGDDPFLKLLKQFVPNASVTTFGFEEENDLVATPLEDQGWLSRFKVRKKDKDLGILEFALLGRHNVLNALAAAAVALDRGVDFSVIQQALPLFQGVERRFQIKGEANNVLVIDDYAHHPTEISHILETARSISKKRVICVFQPHRYTRTRDLKTEFPKALSQADEVVLTDIYGASENPLKGIDGSVLLSESEKAGYENFSYVKELDAIAPKLLSNVKEGDVVMTVGAGDVHRVGEQLIEALKESRE